MSSTEDRTPTRQEIEQQLERIGRSRRFRKARASIKLLKFLVVATLKKSRLSEHTIGVKVFRRRRDWVPLLDSCVRTGRHNLQMYLTEYYADEGSEDLSLIHI